MAGTTFVVYLSETSNTVSDNCRYSENVYYRANKSIP